MNFKYTYLAGVCALAATSLASCSSDTPEPSPADEKVNMAFHISIDDLTRADGTAANGDPQTLQYAVYGTKSDNTQGLLFSDLTETAPQAVKNDDGSFTLNLSLPKNSTFEIAFWAETDVDNTDNTNTADQAYVFDRENATITVNYEKAQFNTTAADAYFAYTEKNTNVSEAVPVSLYRPFSQINIGTTSTTEGLVNLLGNTNAKSLISLTSANAIPNVLNLKDRSVSGGTTSVTFTAARMPQGYEYPASGYTYIGLGYVLSTNPQITILGSEATQDNATTNALTCDLTFTIPGKDTPIFTKDFQGVQLKANTRTNIYGNLLENVSDLNTTINSQFGGETNVPVSKARR